MEDISLLDAIGIASMLGGLGSSEPSIGSTLDDVLDPTGYYKSHGLDPYGRPLSSGGAVNDVRLKGSQGRMGQALDKLNSFRQGYEKGVTPLVNNQVNAVQGLIPQGPLQKGDLIGKGLRKAGAALNNPGVKTALKYAPAVGTALSVGDLVLGDESLANKGMDAAFMAAGGFLGSAVPVVGTGLGMTGGKMLSDGIQFVFGGGKSPEERKLEEALALLQGGIA